MFDAYDMVFEVAESLREEFGVGIDAHPGGTGSEAGVVNRALRATTHCLHKIVAPSKGDVSGQVTLALRHAALRRLGEIGVEDRRAEALLDSEPSRGDAWLAFVALASPEMIGDMLGYPV